MTALGTNQVVRVVRFGIHEPSARKAAMLDDALRRQTIAYGRALDAARPHAIERARVAASLARKPAAAVRSILLGRDRDARNAIVNAAYRAAKGAACSTIQAESLAAQVQATIESWLGWRERFRAERPRRLRRAGDTLAAIEADPRAAAIAALKKRRMSKRPSSHPISTDGLIASAKARLDRERRRQPPAYPTGPRLTKADAQHQQADALDDLGHAISRADENAARDALASEPKIGRTPLSWTRASGDIARGVSIIRTGARTVRRKDKAGWLRITKKPTRLDAFLPDVLPPTAARGITPTWRGPAMLLGNAIETPMGKRRGVRLALSYSKQAWQYLDGQWQPRTAKLVTFPKDGGGWRYELHVAFMREVEQVAPDPSIWIGLDRGVEHIAATSDAEGGDRWTSGNRLAGLERRLRRAREQQQQRGRAIRAGKRAFAEAARNEVNRIAKHVARQVIRRGGLLAAEDLAAFAKGDARVLAKAQYAALLGAVDRQLERAGYAPHMRGGSRVWTVRAAGTSTTCPACGTTAKASRPTRDRFACVGCGHEDHADLNAARVIAARGRSSYEVARGRKAARDGGEGPAAIQAGGIVAAPASAATATSGASGANAGMTDLNDDGARTSSRARSASSVETVKSGAGSGASLHIRSRHLENGQ